MAHTDRTARVEVDPNSLVRRDPQLTAARLADWPQPGYCPEEVVAEAHRQIERWQGVLDRLAELGD